MSSKRIDLTLEGKSAVPVIYSSSRLSSHHNSHDWVAGHSINTFGKLSQHSISDVVGVVVVETTDSDHS